MLVTCTALSNLTVSKQPSASLSIIPAADEKIKAAMAKLVSNSNSFHRYCLHMASSMPDSIDAEGNQDCSGDTLMDVDQGGDGERFNLRGHVWFIPKGHAALMERVTRQDFDFTVIPKELSSLKLFLRCCQQVSKLSLIISSLEEDNTWIFHEALKASTNEASTRFLVKITFFIRKLKSLGKHLTTLSFLSDIPTTLHPEIRHLKEWIVFYRRVLQSFKQICRYKNVKWDQVCAPQVAFQSTAFSVSIATE